MNFPSVEIVYSDSGDWVAVYIDSKWWDSGHDVDYDQLLARLGVPVKTYDAPEDDFDFEAPELTKDLRELMQENGEDD